MRLITPFHIAVPVRDIDEARAFYAGKLGLAEGRSSDHWIDFDMFGHQYVVHLDASLGPNGKVNGISNPVDGHSVPVPHAGVVMPMEEWRAFAERLRGVVAGA